jgi:hypothetical protein
VAGDLIPPPSPAGRPPRQPVLEERPAPEAEPPPPPAAPIATGPSPFRARFGFVFGALAGVAVCAAALAVALAATGGDSDPGLAPNWSEWKPRGEDMLVGAQNIAQHVAEQYKLDNGNEFVRVQSSGLQGMPVGVLPLGGTTQFLEGDGLIYALDGLGPNRTLPGTPSEERGLLLRREALELALYTFRYLEDATMVAVLMPPIEQEGEEGAQPNLVQRAVFFRPGDLLAQLQVPLEDTLSRTTPRPRTITPQEAARIDGLTLRNLFIASSQTSESGPYLLLREPAGIN